MLKNPGKHSGGRPGPGPLVTVTSVGTAALTMLNLLEGHSSKIPQAKLVGPSRPLQQMVFIFSVQFSRSNDYQWKQTRSKQRNINATRGNGCTWQWLWPQTYARTWAAQLSWSQMVRTTISDGLSPVATSTYTFNISCMFGDEQRFSFNQWEVKIICIWPIAGLEADSKFIP